jgi:hypothetical protein
MNGSGDMTAAFSAALESADAADASPASTPVPETTPTAPIEGEATAAAIAQPVAETTAPDPATTEEKPKGEPPAWRWQDILENARKTTAEETAARVRQEIEAQYAEVRDFQSMTSEERAGLKVWQQAMAGDPAAQAHIRTVAQSNPALAQTLRAFVGAEQAQAVDPEPQPDAAIQLADGTQVPVYTADGQRKREAWLRNQLAPELETRLMEKFKPLAATAEKLQALERNEQAKQASTQWATQIIAPLSKLPYFAEFKPDLSKALLALPETATGEQMQAAVYDAYTTLLTAKTSALTTQETSKAVAAITQRAVAGTTNPSSASTATPKTFAPTADGFADALAHFGG